MRRIAHAIFLCLFFHCLGQAGTDLYQILEDQLCPGETDLRGIGVGDSESEALALARANMAREYFARNLEDKVQISGQNVNRVGSSSTKTNTKMETSLANPRDAKLHYSKRQGKKNGAVVCMRREDAVKGILRRQRQTLDSLELLSAAWHGAANEKQKNEIWDKTQSLWRRMPYIPRDWGIENENEKPKAEYEGIREMYMDWMRTPKKSWWESKTENYANPVRPIDLNSFYFSFLKPMYSGLNAMLGLEYMHDPLLLGGGLFVGGGIFGNDIKELIWGIDIKKLFWLSKYRAAISMSLTYNGRVQYSRIKNSIAANFIYDDEFLEENARNPGGKQEMSRKINDFMPSMDLRFFIGENYSLYIGCAYRITPNIEDWVVKYEIPSKKRLDKYDGDDFDVPKMYNPFKNIEENPFIIRFGVNVHGYGFEKNGE